MLMACPKCEQVIEISELTEHLIVECEQSKDAYDACSACGQAILHSELEAHARAGPPACRATVHGVKRCPLCAEEVELGADGKQGWSMHFLEHGCTANPRPKPSL